MFLPFGIGMMGQYDEFFQLFSKKKREDINLNQGTEKIYQKRLQTVFVFVRLVGICQKL